MQLNSFQTALLLAVMASFHFGLMADAAEPSGKRPNVILIMADDLGVECLGAYGGISYATPHLDRLAREGLRFTHAYSQPLCTNTRIQLMTGKYNNRNWLYFGILDPREKTFGHYMREAGYHTCLAGKWQLHSYDPPDYPGAGKRRGTGMRVEAAGFDRYCAWHVGHTEDKGSRYADPRVSRDGELLDLPGEYGPDVFTRYITDYLEEQQKITDRPFFVYYSMALPHWPMVPTPRSADWADPSLRFEEDTQYFKDMVEYMDQCVGRIVDKVDALGLAEETLILFYSDNGTHLKITSETSAGPVQGGKGMTTDAGTHVPLIARWSGHVQCGVNHDLIDSTDFLPTLVEVAGERIPVNERLDGISFYPALVGDKFTSRKFIFSHYDPRPGWDKDQFTKIRFVRNQNYKLYGDGRLFHVREDRLELKPLEIADDASRVSTVRERFQRVLDSMPNPEPALRD